MRSGNEFVYVRHNHLTSWFNIITRLRGINRQVVNKALSGNLQAARMVFDWIRQEMAAEQPQNSRNKPDRKLVDMTDEELLMILQVITPNTR
jgi:hypothetical protein